MNIRILKCCSGILYIFCCHSFGSQSDTMMVATFWVRHSQIPLEAADNQKMERHERRKRDEDEQQKWKKNISNDNKTISISSNNVHIRPETILWNSVVIVLQVNVKQFFSSAFAFFAFCSFRNVDMQLSKWIVVKLRFKWFFFAKQRERKRKEKTRESFYDCRTFFCHFSFQKKKREVVVYVCSIEKKNVCNLKRGDAFWLLASTFFGMHSASNTICHILNLRFDSFHGISTRTISISKHIFELLVEKKEKKRLHRTVTGTMSSSILLIRWHVFYKLKKTRWQIFGKFLYIYDFSCVFILFRIFLSAE